VLLDQFLGFDDPLWLEAIIRIKLNPRFNPELRFTVGMLDMYVGTRLFSREEVKAEPSNSEDSRTHPYRIADSLGDGLATFVH